MLQKKDLYRGFQTEGVTGFFARFDQQGRLIRIEFKRDGVPQVQSLEIDQEKKTGLRKASGGEEDRFKDGEAYWCDDDPLGDGQGWHSYKIEFEKWCQKQIRKFYDSVSPEKCLACDRTPVEAGKLLSDSLTLHFLCSDCARYFFEGMDISSAEDLPDLPKRLSRTTFIFKTADKSTGNCCLCETPLSFKFVDVFQFGRSGYSQICKACIHKSAGLKV